MRENKGNQPTRPGSPNPCKQALRLAKQQLCTCITLFCVLLCRHCTTTTWKYLTSRFVRHVRTRQRLSFSFPKLWYSLLEFNSRKNCQHLTNWTRWNKRHKVGRSATSLFKSRFLSRRRRRCLSSFIISLELTAWKTVPRMVMWAFYTKRIPHEWEAQPALLYSVMGSVWLNRLNQLRNLDWVDGKKHILKILIIIWLRHAMCAGFKLFKKPRTTEVV